MILMDVRMPGVDGVEATRRIHARHPDIMIVMLTTYDDDQYVRRAVHNGAIGYLLKDVPPRELFTAIRAIREGSFIMPTPLAAKLFETSGADVYHGGAGDGQIPDWYYELTRHERQILRLIVDGYNNHEIAMEVHLAPQTVKNYSSRIYAKMGVHSRSDAIRAARRLIKYL
jgi:DNA-binding NarL/FixJ family response regulator